MKETKPQTKQISLSKRLCFTALFSALCLVGTLISVPLPIGYFNLGDVFVLLSAWCLGPLFGGTAAAVGSALADLFLGYSLYAPATFVIKGCVALTASLLPIAFHIFIKKESLLLLSHALAATLAETVMIAGYFLFESLLLGYGWGATASLLGNSLQAAVGIIGGTVLLATLKRLPPLKKLFPRL